MKARSTKWYAWGLSVAVLAVAVSGCAQQATDNAAPPAKNKAAERQEKALIKPPADFPIYKAAEFQDNKVTLDDRGNRHYNGLYRTTDSTDAVIAFYMDALPKAKFKVATQPEANRLAFFRETDEANSNLRVVDIQKGKYRVLEVDVVFPR